MSTGPSRRILIVEDEADACRNMCDILELFGYQPVVAMSVKAALARDDWTDYSVIVLDRRLPDGTAQDLLPELKRLAPRVPVIIVTGYADLEGAVACLQAGAADYISKPIEPETLRARLRHLIERREAEVALERREREFRALADNVPALFAYVDCDRRYQYVNKRYEELFQQPQAEFIGKHIREVLGEQVYREIERHNLAALAGQPQSFEVELPLFGSSVRSMNVVYVPAYGTTGDVEGYLVLMSDTTARKRAEQRALQAERLAAIGQMMTGLAHESRNTLQRSRACLEMLALEVADQPEALNLVRRVQKAQEDLEQLYEEVREYAAPIKLTLEIEDVQSVWREAWAHLAHLHNGKQLQLVEQIQTHHRECLVDRFGLQQVFRNILENALVVSPARGTITIDCADSPLESCPGLRIAIRDQGPGLSPEERERIFEPFFTTKTKGTGLGMPIAQRIVQAHGGQIAVGPAGECGAEIIVVLPRGDL